MFLEKRPFVFHTQNDSRAVLISREDLDSSLTLAGWMPIRMTFSSTSKPVLAFRSLLFNSPNLLLCKLGEYFTMRFTNLERNSLAGPDAAGRRTICLHPGLVFSELKSSGNYSFQPTQDSSIWNVCKDDTDLSFSDSQVSASGHDSC